MCLGLGLIEGQQMRASALLRGMLKVVPVKPYLSIFSPSGRLYCPLVNFLANGEKRKKKKEEKKRKKTSALLGYICFNAMGYLPVIITK